MTKGKAPKTKPVLHIKDLNPGDRFTLANLAGRTGELVRVGSMGASVKLDAYYDPWTEQKVYPGEQIISEYTEVHIL